MELERLIPNVRPRNNWEASDLGVLMARHWFAPLAICFMVPMVLVTLLGLTFLYDSPLLLPLWVWWFKPLYERLPLHYLSRAIFAEAPVLTELFKQPRAALGTELLAALTYRRLSLRRSFIAPIFVLERLSGKRAAERSKALSLQTESFANWLTILGLHIETALLLGASIALLLLLPDQWLAGTIETVFGGNTTEADWVFNAFGLIAFVVFGPFYVSCGFALYLNRRVALEAWDVEIAFRRLAERLTPKRNRPPDATVALGLVLLVSASLLSGHAPIARADTGPPHTDSATAESRQVIADIMAGPDFHQMDTRRYPKFLQDWFEDTLDPAEDETPELGGLLGWLRGLATFFEVVLWVCAGLLVLWLASRLSGLNIVTLPARSTRPVAPSNVFGIELAGAALPEDVHGTARTLWQQGKLREALSLLLRAQLLRLVSETGCHFSSGDTEQECLQEVRSRAPEAQHSAFAQLMNLWLRVAYAHRQPLDAEFERVCRSLEAATIAVDR